MSEKIKKRILIVVLAGIILGSGSLVLVHQLQKETETPAEVFAPTEPKATVQTTEYATDYGVPLSIVTEEQAQQLSQEDLFNRMLNSIDYYNLAAGEFEIQENVDPAPLTVEYEANLPEGRSYTNTQNAQFNQECYSDGTTITQYDNRARSFVSSGGAVLKEDALQISEPRVDEDEDGIPIYRYRATPTNSGYLNNSLFSQERTFGFLSDFNLWSIEGTEEYAGRLCVKVVGTTNPNYGQKLNIASFEMRVDAATGILLNLEGKSASGETTNFIRTNSIAIDSPSKLRSATSQLGVPDPAKYAGYKNATYTHE